MDRIVAAAATVDDSLKKDCKAFVASLLITISSGNRRSDKAILAPLAQSGFLKAFFLFSISSSFCASLRSIKALLFALLRPLPPLIKPP